jgi:hypothetical protein
MVGRMTSKSSLSTTLICGSNAAGEALPPHIQFATKAQSKETMRLDIDSFDHIPDVRGRWGFLQEENKNVTFGMNEKGGTRLLIPAGILRNPVNYCFWLVGDRNVKFGS